MVVGKGGDLCFDSFYAVQCDIWEISFGSWLIQSFDLRRCVPPVPAAFPSASCSGTADTNNNLIK